VVKNMKIPEKTKRNTETLREIRRQNRSPEIER